MRALSNDQHPDAEDAKVSQRTQKKTFFRWLFLLRPLRNFCVLCVRKLGFHGASPDASKSASTTSSPYSVAKASACRPRAAR
jgi:hypothetical protein